MSVTVASLIPASGTVGSVLVITGTGFNTPITTITFNAIFGSNYRVGASFVINSDTTIHVTVPSPGGSAHYLFPGALELNTASEFPAAVTEVFQPSSSGNAPTVSSASVGSGYPGTPITLTGVGFTGSTTLTIGGKLVPFAIINDAQIKTWAPPLPPGGGALDIVVTNAEGSGTLSAVFTISGYRSMSPVFDGQIVKDLDSYKSFGPVHDALVLAIPFLSSSPVFDGRLPATIGTIFSSPVYDGVIYEAPDAPTGLAATTISTTEIDLAWNAVVGATSYILKRATVHGGPYSTVVTQGTRTYQDTGRTAGLTYFYVVEAVSIYGTSADSVEASAATLLPPVGVTPTVVSAIEIDLSWTPSASATGYIVKRSLVPGGPYTLIGTPAGTSYADTGLSPNTTYYYVVEATTASATSIDSVQVSGTTLSHVVKFENNVAGVVSFQKVVAGVFTGEF